MSKQIGGIFGEGITGGHQKFFRGQTHRRLDPHIRLIFMLVILIVSIGVLLTRIFELTVLEGKYFRTLSEENRIREKKIAAPRGILYDRNGYPLVHNIPWPPSSNSGQVPYSITREYPYGEVFAHAVGFTGEINQQELNELNAKLAASISYSAGDVIGKTGIEKSYEDKIRGIDGKELFEVDALGKSIRSLGRIEPKPGKNLTLTLDLDLQKTASGAMEERKGAVIATDPRTGEILSFYSSPSFDPNKFTTRADFQSIFKDQNNPMFDRVIGGTYPPGSTYKIVVSLAGLETGAIDAQTQIEDTGVISVGQFSFPNWYFMQYGKKEGMVDIVKAIKRSNDIFFYKTGEALGVDRLATWSKKLGLGNTLGVDIDGEAKGIVPDTNWKKRTRGEPWYLGDTYHIAIGQGDLLTTPLQVNAWTNVIANGGKLCKPYLVKSEPKPEECKDLGIKKENIGLIREGMKEACSTGGTGWPLFEFKVNSSKLKIDGKDFLATYESTTSARPMVGIPAACKTGTAEFGDAKGATHAWFTVFAPVYNPQISITVLVEGAGEGSNVAAPIAKKMLNEWFGK